MTTKITPTEVLLKARQFLADEPEAVFCQELEKVIEKAELGEPNALADLTNRFSQTLLFGTAGFRGRMESGLNRLNRPMVMRSAWAIGTHFKAPKIVIGFDARRMSSQFAQDTAHVLLGLGCEVYLFPSIIATPICSFAVEHLKATAGIMITASHNPPDDNGIKVYGASGAQIVAPVTTAIENLLLDSPSFVELEKIAPTVDNNIKYISEDLINAYFSCVKKNSLHPKIAKKVDVRIVYTPMHGVGTALTVKALKDSGFHDVHCVKSQEAPDGNFPTVLFPNPEEAGALDEAIKTAQSCNAELILANDPDADRLAVVVFDKTSQNYVTLSGNEIGILLGADILQHADTLGQKKLTISSLVSSRMLSKMAKNFDASYVDTNTGFAFIMKAALERSNTLHEKFVFGYEEALGYCVGDFVHDKDGVCAAVRMAELFAYLKQQNTDCLSELCRLALVHGVFETLQWSARFDGASAGDSIAGILKGIRKDPKSFLGEHFVIASWEDLSESKNKSMIANVIIVTLSNNVRIVIRPSGTEPKIKFYLEAAGQAHSIEQVAMVKNDLRQLLESVRSVIQTTVLSSKGHLP